MRRIQPPAGAWRKLLLAEAKVMPAQIQRATGINQGRLSEELHSTQVKSKENRKKIYDYYRKNAKVKPVTFEDFWDWAVVLEKTL